MQDDKESTVKRINQESRKESQHVKDLMQTAEDTQNEEEQRKQKKTEAKAKDKVKKEVIKEDSEITAPQRPDEFEWSDDNVRKK